MRVRVSGQKARSYRGPLLALGIFQGMRSPEGVLKDLDDLSRGWAKRVLGSGDFGGKTGDILIQQTHGALPCARLMLLGLGEREKFALDEWRGVASGAAQASRRLGVKQFALSVDVPLERAFPKESLAAAAVEGALLGLYRFGPYKTEKPEDVDPEEMVLLSGGRSSARLNAAVSEAVIVSESVQWVRDLVAQPGNRMTPTVLGERAVAMARKWGIRHRVLDEREIGALKMGGLLGVASGSKEPPRLIVLEHLASDRKARKVALVGKGITFDSGGISLKPAEKMDLMKHDMAGGAAVLGTIQVAARLKLPVGILAIVPATENLPSGAAYKPGDVLTTMSGQTIEVTNTDAEGRVVLSDALFYALQFRPDMILDLATLTGACIVALGDRIAGVMGNDPSVTEALQRAGQVTGEDLWPLPLKDEYEDYIKSDIADVKNSGGREAGAIQGGLFLRKFVKDTPWAHLDIAGPVWTEKDRPYRPKGATGFGVRLLVEFLKDHCSGAR